MIVAFQIVCLFFAFYTLHTYIETETHSRAHRLLPLLMGLICLYDFEKVITGITGDSEHFIIAKDFLIIQIFYLLIHYVLNFFYIKVKRRNTALLLCSLLLVDGGMLFRIFNGKSYLACFLPAFIGYYSIIVGITVYANIKLSFSEQERNVDRLLLSALFLPGIAVFTRFTDSYVLKDIGMPAALLGSCCIVLYLLKTEQLMDITSFLQEKLFDRSDIPILLFDADYFYLNANSAAKELFPELRKLTRKRSCSHKSVKIEKLSAMPDMTEEVKIGENYYKCMLSEQYNLRRKKGYVLVVFDITRQKKETKLMEELKREAEYQSIMKSRFLARMSYDMKNPIRSMIEASQILAKKRNISARNRILLKQVKNAGDIVLDIMHSMIEFSKLETGELTLQEQEYHFDALIEELSRINVRNLYSKPVHFEARIQGWHPARLIGDDVRVREVIHNILSNAVKFTNSGEISCNITMEDCQNEQIYVTCMIKDSGLGMTKQQIEQNLMSEIGSKGQEDLGFGLRISKQIVELLGGELTVESDGENGSCVTISFYQKSAGEERVPEVVYATESILLKENYEQEAFQVDIVYPDAQILVADDMRINRVIFLEEIGIWKCKTDCVANGQLAVDAVKDKKYDLIFIDYMMPIMTGMEAARKIKEIWPDAVIVMMTGESQEEIWEEAKQAGITDYLSKPYQMSDLQNILEKYLPQKLQRNAELRALPETQMAALGQAHYAKIVKTFVDEIDEFQQHMEEYFVNNLELFRVKVHGIKGVCKQLNIYSMGEYAEVMEMAAKTENIRFIKEHLETFHSDILYLLEQMREDLARIREIEGDSQKKQEWKESQEKLWEQLREAFAQYHLDQIKDSLCMLSDRELSPKEQEIVKQAENCYEELEYEEGYLLVDAFIRQEKTPG